MDWPGQAFDQLMDAPVDKFDLHSEIESPAAPLCDVVIPAVFRRLPSVDPRICPI